MKEEKILQIVNLSPSEDWVEKIVEVHPMKQIFWASIIQGCVFGFMLFSFWGISMGLEAEELDLTLPETDFDFRQIEEDGKSIMNLERNAKFNIENPKHKYFLVINILDSASTLYAMENRNTLRESNILLPDIPKAEHLFVQKALSIYALRHLGIFSEHPEDQWYINALNTTLTFAVLNNLYQINKHD